mmetsp:Transcript_43809/g.103575  ORF Transcript_43809/g.103575 Transcript_43809/m.103575 type:complete len:724 (+) Transcript_43809:78-2249(+)
MERSHRQTPLLSSFAGLGSGNPASEGYRELVLNQNEPGGRERVGQLPESQRPSRLLEEQVDEPDQNANYWHGSGSNSGAFCGLSIVGPAGARSVMCSDTCFGDRLAAEREKARLAAAQSQSTLHGHPRSDSRSEHRPSTHFSSSEGVEDAMTAALSIRKNSTRKQTMTGDFSVRVNDKLKFVTSSEFQGLMACIIGLNALVLALELDYQAPTPTAATAAGGSGVEMATTNCLIASLALCEGGIGWLWLDNFFQVVFTLELVLREQYKGWRAFLCNKGQDTWWNIFDTFLVVEGAVELWIVPFYKVNSAEKRHFLKMLRLLRLLRLIRAVRMIRRLSLFMEAIVHMLNPLFWVMSTFFMGLGLVAVIMTHLVGRGEGMSEESLSDPLYVEIIQPRFGTVTTSFYSLFQVVTVDNWTPIAFPLMHLNSSWRWFFIFFIAFASWTMISILTAVASENVIGAASDRAEKEREAAERRQKEFIAFLRRFFHEADQDGNGVLDKEEFDNIVEADRLQSKLSDMDINVDKEDLLRTWEMLDVRGDGELGIDEFVDGLVCLQDGLSTKYVVNLDYSIRSVAVQIENRLGKLEAHVEGWKSRNEVLLHSLRRQHKLQQEQTVALWAWRQWAAKSYPGTVRPQVLSAISGSKWSQVDGMTASKSEPVESGTPLIIAPAPRHTKNLQNRRHKDRRRGSMNSLYSRDSNGPPSPTSSPPSPGGRLHVTSAQSEPM